VFLLSFELGSALVPFYLKDLYSHFVVCSVHLVCPFCYAGFDYCDYADDYFDVGSCLVFPSLFC
jgi:hypothetical protein